MFNKLVKSVANAFGITDEATDAPPTPEEQSKLDEKDLEKKIKSYIEVAKHKFGRTPSMSEVVQMMSENDDNPDDNQFQDGRHQDDNQPLDDDDISGEPRILHTKIYHGMTDDENGNRIPDPSKILYYESPEGDVYDTNPNVQSWLPDRPPFLDHLPSRSMSYDQNDVFSAIMHGVMDNDDYEALHGAGMINENQEQLWELKHQLYNQLMQLTSAEDAEQMQKSDWFGDYDDDGESDSSEQADDGDSAPVDSQLGSQVQSASAEPDMPGEDVIAQIMQGAMSKALTGFEDQIRAIVREELGKGNSSPTATPGISVGGEPPVK